MGCSLRSMVDYSLHDDRSSLHGGGLFASLLNPPYIHPSIRTAHDSQ
jgi:hypothetical protein